MYPRRYAPERHVQCSRLRVCRETVDNYMDRHAVSGGGCDIGYSRSVSRVQCSQLMPVTLPRCIGCDCAPCRPTQVKCTPPLHQPGRPIHDPPTPKEWKAELTWVVGYIYIIRYTEMVCLSADSRQSK